MTSARRRVRCRRRLASLRCCWDPSWAVKDLNSPLGWTDKMANVHTGYNLNPRARWPFVSLGLFSRQPISCFLRWQSSHRCRYSRKSWPLQFHGSELHFQTRPPNLCSHRRCERDFVLIPTHFYHATTLQLSAFARHSASWPAGPMTIRHFDLILAFFSF